MTRRPDRDEDRPGRGAPSSAVRRLAWFAALWLAGVLAVGAVALVIRFWLGL